MYSTWFSVPLRGYCERSFRDGCALGFGRWSADKDECCEDSPIEGVLDSELGSETLSASKFGGSGDREGRDPCDICDADREEGNEEREVRR
jgi:hypothetical protein